MAHRFNSISDATALGASIRAKRLTARLTTLELAQRADVHHSTVVRAEHGRFATLSESVQKICTALNIRWDADLGHEAESLTTRLRLLLERKPEFAAIIGAVIGALEQQGSK